MVAHGDTFSYVPFSFRGKLFLVNCILFCYILYIYSLYFNWLWHPGTWDREGHASLWQTSWKVCLMCVWIVSGKVSTTGWKKFERLIIRSVILWFFSMHNGLKLINLFSLFPRIVPLFMEAPDLGTRDMDTTWRMNTIQYRCKTIKHIYGTKIKLTWKTYRS